MRSVDTNDGLREPGHAPRQPAAGHVPEDVGVAAEVEAADDGHVADRAGADRSLRHPPQAQRRIPLAVVALLVEAVRAAVVGEVDEVEAVAERPARRLLHGEDRRVGMLPRERVDELPVLVVELGLRARGGRPDQQQRDDAQPATSATRRMGASRVCHPRIIVGPAGRPVVLPDGEPELTANANGPKRPSSLCLARWPGENGLGRSCHLRARSKPRRSASGSAGASAAPARPALGAVRI